MGRRPRSGLPRVKDPTLSRGSSRVSVATLKKNARQRACARLGLDPAPEPNYTICNYIQSIRGSKKGFIDYARLCDDDEIKKVVDLWDSLTANEKICLQINDLCVAASVSWPYLVGRVNQVMWECGKEETHARMAQYHPLVVEKTIKYAMAKDGYRDREMLHRAAGFLPIPKGATIINKFQPQTIPSQLPTVNDEPIDVDELPPFERDSMQLQKAVRGELPPAPEK